MSEVRTAYRTAILADFDYENDDAMQELGWQVSNQIAAAMSDPDGLMHLQRAADLVTLSEMTSAATRIVIPDPHNTGGYRVFEGANAIAEAAAFVRQNGAENG